MLLRRFVRTKWYRVHGTAKRVRFVKYVDSFWVNGVEHYIFKPVKSVSKFKE